MRDMLSCQNRTRMSTTCVFWRTMIANSRASATTPTSRQRIRRLPMPMRTQRTMDQQGRSRTRASLESGTTPLPHSFGFRPCRELSPAPVEGTA